MSLLLNYTKTGQGEPLIILHGLFGSSSNWRTIAKHLASQYCVYCLDARNHGDSPWADSMSFQDMAEDVIHFINHHNLDRPHLLGHSMGGKTAMTVALQHPEKINKLIVADIAPKPYYHNQEHERFIEAMLALRLDELTGGRKEAQQILSEVLKEPIGVIQFLLQNLNFKDQQYKWRLNLSVIQQELDTIMGIIDLEQPGRSDLKSFFVYGMNSNYLSQQDENLIRQIFPGSTIKGIENAGHWLHAEQPEQFLAVLTRFLTGDSVTI